MSMPAGTIPVKEPTINLLIAHLPISSNTNSGISAVFVATIVRGFQHEKSIAPATRDNRTGTRTRFSNQASGFLERSLSLSELSSTPEKSAKEETRKQGPSTGGPRQKTCSR